MSFAKKPEMAPPVLRGAGYIQPYLPFKDYEEQIIAYFSGRSVNAAFQWDAEKLEKRFKNTCNQVERFIFLQEKV